MVPGGVFGLPHAGEEEIDVDPDSDLGLDGLDDGDDLFDVEAEQGDAGGLHPPPPRQARELHPPPPSRKPVRP
jgi:hypothetical protein